MRNEEEILKRITNTLKEQGKLQKGLVAYLGLTKGTYANWNRKQSYSFMCYLKDISEYLDVTVEYLVTGKKDKEEIVKYGDVIPPNIYKDSLALDTDKDILTAYHNLSAAGKEYIRNELRRLSKYNHNLFFKKNE